MVEGLFLNWIDINGYRVTVNKAAQFAFDIHACPAFAAFSGLNGAFLSAEKAFYDNGLVLMPFFVQRCGGLMTLGAFRCSQCRGCPVSCFRRILDKAVFQSIMSGRDAGSGPRRPEGCRTGGRPAGHQADS